MRKTILTENDYNEFYKTMLYGNMTDTIVVAIKSAYRDVCRTITGFAKHKRHDEILCNCSHIIYEYINRLNGLNSLTQEDFDLWHKWACKKLISFFEDQKFTYGQAQKWINMSIKYVSMFDHKMTEKYYEYCHVPIDNYIIGVVGYKFKTAWSRIDTYDEYLDFQIMFRNKYKKIPLDEEFYMWINASKEERNHGKK